MEPHERNADVVPNWLLAANSGGGRGDHSGIVYRLATRALAYNKTRNDLDAKPARCSSCKAFKVVVETQHHSLEDYN